MKRYAASGFSLVELMIASFIGGVLSIGIIQVTSDSVRTGEQVRKHGELSDNARYLMDVLNREIQLAGFYGALEFYDTDADDVPPDPCPTTNQAELEEGMNYPVFGYDEPGLTCFGSLLSGSDVLVLRRAGTNAAATLEGGTYYLQTTSLDDPILLASTNAADFPLIYNGSATAAPIRRYHQDVYFLAANGEFTRARLDGNAYTNEVLADGVDDFQIEFGIDRDGDGVAEADDANPVTNPAYEESPTGEEWKNVVSVRAHLVVRTRDAGSGAVAKTLTYADKTRTWDDNFRRGLFSTTVQATNAAIKRYGDDP